jgi:hypothetical protein
MSSDRGRSLSLRSAKRADIVKSRVQLEMRQKSLELERRKRDVVEFEMGNLKLEVEQSLLDIEGRMLEEEGSGSQDGAFGEISERGWISFSVEHQECSSNSTRR